MAQSAKLGADHLKFSGFQGAHPDIDGLSGHRVLLDPQHGNKKAVQHVLGAKKDVNGDIERNMQPSHGDHVVACRGIVLIDPERILLIHQFQIGFPEFSVGAGVADVPGELFGHDLDPQCVFGNSLFHAVPHVSGDLSQHENFSSDHEHGKKCDQSKLESPAAVGVKTFFPFAAAIENKGISHQGIENQGQDRGEDEKDIKH